MPKLGKGIRVTASGYQIYCRRHGTFYSQHLPRSTPIEDLPGLQRNLEARAQLQIAAPADTDGTLTADVREYLKAKRGMPTYTDRAYRIEWWRDVLGKRRSRESVTALEIRQHLETRRKAAAKPGTLNLYRTALFDFFATMNGAEGANPVRGVKKYHEEELPLTLPTWPEAERAIQAVGGKRKTSKSRVILTALLWTGWPSATLKRLRPVDFRPKKKEATVHARRKGGGTKPQTLPLLPQAVTALGQLLRLKDGTTWDKSSLHSALQRGCKAAGVHPFRVYDLRHLFATTIVTNSQDERGAAELLMHSSPHQTRRYSRHAASTRAKSALTETAKKLK